MDRFVLERQQLAHCAVELLKGGSGPPLLFLHGDVGPTVFSDRYLDLLAADFTVFAPWHPGFGGSERPAGFHEAGDLAYAYLDLSEALGLRDATLVGASFGGWIAAEMMVRSTERFAQLVLIDPFGIKAGDRETRDYTDMFAVTPDEWFGTLFRERQRWVPEITALTDEALTDRVRGSEALAHYGWQPYMHNPQLRQWLHRIKIPTLILRGEDDRVVRAEVHQAFAAAIPQSRLSLISQAGHYPHIEQPAGVAAVIAAFACRQSGVAVAVG